MSVTSKRAPRRRCRPPRQSSRGPDNFLDDCEPEAGSVAVRCKPRIEDVFAFSSGCLAVVFDVETIIFNSTDPIVTSSPPCSMALRNRFSKSCWRRSGSTAKVRSSSTTSTAFLWSTISQQFSTMAASDTTTAIDCLTCRANTSKSSIKRSIRSRVLDRVFAEVTTVSRVSSDNGSYLSSVFVASRSS